MPDRGGRCQSRQGTDVVPEATVGNFRLEGYIDVPAHRVRQIDEALKDHIRLTRNEPGCVYFRVDPCKETVGRYLVSEAFVDKEAFDFHQQRAANSQWAEVSMPSC